MTREIKFRAKRKDNKEWLYWSVIDGFSNPKDILEIETIGQFTGLYDQHGKKIYEGDILRFVDGNAVVKFEEGCFDAYFKCGTPAASNFFWKDDCEVIGNIHDNPELIEKL